MSSFTKLKSILRERDRFLLICHQEPDGDAIGSMIALNYALSNLGKEVICICKDNIPSVFSFLIEENQINQNFEIKKNDVLILIDNGDLRRTGMADEISKLSNLEPTVKLINIDHHQKNDLWKLASINVANPEKSSTAEIIYEIMKFCGYYINSRIATCLLAGIYNDTGGFRHSNTTPEVLTIVADLLSLGGKLKLISEHISYSKPVNGLNLWGLALSRMKLLPNYNAIASVITLDDLKKCNATEDEIPGLVNYLNTIPGANIAVLIYEGFDGRIRGSLRTESDTIDLSKFAGLLGGGGHKKASGFSISGKIQIDDANNWQII